MGCRPEQLVLDPDGRPASGLQGLVLRAGAGGLEAGLRLDGGHAPRGARARRARALDVVRAGREPR
eukprot:408939-Alexandrium_andersonii.AAC.1